jgi:hypothetical protein
MHHGCASRSAHRSDSSEWPSKMVEGVMIVWRCACTSARFVVTGSNISTVIPDKINLWLSGPAKGGYKLSTHQVR